MVYCVIFQYGTTPLIWACRKGHTEIVEMLLHAGAVADKAGMVLCSYACFLLFIGPPTDNLDIVRP